MHPETDVEQNHGGGDTGHALGDFPGGAAQVDQGGSHVPGGNTGRQSQYPAVMNVTGGGFGVGLAGEGQQRGDDQQRLQPFPEQDEETGGEGGGGAQAITTEDVLRFLQTGAGLSHPVTDFRFRQATLDAFAHGHEAAFDAPHDSRIHGGELLLDHFEAVQVGGQRGGAGGTGIAGGVGLLGFRQFTVTDLDEAVLAEQRLGLGTQVAGGVIGLVTQLIAHVFRRLGDHRVQGQSGFQLLLVIDGGLAAGGHVRGHRHAADIEGQRPAVGFTQGLFIGGHAGAFHTAGDGGVQTQQGTAFITGQFMEIGGRRLQRGTSGAITAPIRAVTQGTGALINLRGPRHIRRRLGHHRDAVDVHQGTAYGLGQGFHLGLRRLVGHRLLQGGGLLQQGVPAFHIVQLTDPFMQQTGELFHLHVFFVADDGAVLHRIDVVGADVFHQLHQSGLGGGLSQG